jgi:hypothetical protein
MNGISAFRRSFSCKKNKKMICKALKAPDSHPCLFSSPAACGLLSRTPCKSGDPGYLFVKDVVVMVVMHTDVVFLG